MPVVALALFAVFAALGFGWRSWEQRRRIGSTGFRGISGRLGSAEWFAGVGFVAALAAAVIASLPPCCNSWVWYRRGVPCTRRGSRPPES
jgi:hypothetical protein